MSLESLAQLIFPDEDKGTEYYESLYPPRSLPEGAKVTRIAPSPTGFMHLGNLYGALTDERLAHQSGGVFMLRIEDTDSKREVENGVEMIIAALGSFGLVFDEGMTADGEKGSYGPYRQSNRAHIYHAFAKKLLLEGKAYPCFCTEEELAAMHEKQEAEKANFGYYGKWAKYRSLPTDEAEALIRAGKPFVLRFRSEGSEDRYLHLDDMIRGRIDVPENCQDFVLLKSDGIPTYHFAHVVDDHLMRVTHVVRGEEWLATWPIHIQLFASLGWKSPKYCHTAHLMKAEGNGKRKLSKRKDPELALSFYRENGYPVESVREYLMTLLNSNFEEWRLANPSAALEDFKFSVSKMGSSGALFDLDKLRDVSRNVVASMTAQQVYDRVLDWAKEYDPSFAELLEGDERYALRILSIGRGGKKPRKDIALWSDVKPYMSMFYPSLFVRREGLPDGFDRSDIKKALELFCDTYDENDTQEQWFARIKEIAASLGYAPETKLYKQSPDSYRGHVGDISMFIRVALTGSTNSPDMYEIMPDTWTRRKPFANLRLCRRHMKNSVKGR